MELLMWGEGGPPAVHAPEAGDAEPAMLLSAPEVRRRPVELLPAWAWARRRLAGLLRAAGRPRPALQMWARPRLPPAMLVLAGAARPLPHAARAAARPPPCRCSSTPMVAEARREFCGRHKLIRLRWSSFASSRK
ncbi:hypothetical protein PAHAL_1G174100 [Panicum hallii]|uniref:Uncharacterized protein n=1 Tax=Panicum hallii TaxID=206008 RepID=A0A2S3GNU5_9POAL|nr:hypothetical protein PAHAL_1G174100 [Panicum hallii]